MGKAFIETNLPCAGEELLGCLEAALHGSYAAICGQAPRPAPENRRERGVPSGDGLLIGVLSLVGDISLTMMLALPHGTARLLSRKFIGTALAPSSAEMDVLVGELVNIVAGDAAARLESLGLQVQLSLPAVIRGGGLAYCRSGTLLSRELAYEGNEGPFWMTILISEGGLPTSPMPGCGE